MNSDQLIKFKTIVECGTLSKAAEKLYISQPALSYTIAALERETECQLFTRDKNKLILTADGQRLLEYAMQISDVLSRATQAMRNRNKISIPCNNIAATMLLSNLSVSDLLNVRLIQASEEDFPGLLLNGTLDAATCDDFYMKELLQTNPDIQMEKYLIFRESLGLLVPPSHILADREEIHYEDLVDVSLCAQSDAASLMLWLQNIEKLTGISFRLDYAIDHITLEHIHQKLECAEIRRSSDAVSSSSRLP